MTGVIRRGSKGATLALTMFDATAYSGMKARTGCSVRGIISAPLVEPEEYIGFVWS